ncbi:MAG: GAF and ANTAR domain-containing protein [Gemmatimonadales bacterium]
MTEEGAAAAEAILSGQPPTLSGEELCRPFIALLPVTGASLSVFGWPGQHSTIHASDTVAARIDALQFELGEGPRWEALHTGQPVLIPDLAQDQHSGWPIFGAAVREVGVGALFVFPLVLGAATVGAIDLYRSTAGVLGASDVAQALALARSIAGPAVRRAAWSAGEESPNVDLAPELRREVHQATGMILAQLSTSATEAFARLRAHAFASDRSVEDVARDVVSRRLDFGELTD